MVGLVLYISSINDEMLNRTKDAETYFSYKYGWSFAFAAISFLLTEVTLPTGWAGSGACPGPAGGDGRQRTPWTHHSTALCPWNVSWFTCSWVAQGPVPVPTPSSSHHCIPLPGARPGPQQ